MGIFLKQDIAENLILAIWEISESLEELMQEVELSGKELQVLSQMKFESHKKQWIAARILINTLLPEGKNQIDYTVFGKPFLVDCPYKISLTHSEKFVAVIVNKNEETGIDIEPLGAKVDRVKHKFLNEAELNTVPVDFSTEYLHVLWGAKEALYKLYGRKGLIFKEDLLIDAFKFNGSGIISGTISVPDYTQRFNLWYEKIQEHMLVYVVGEN